jgi:purine nucleoside phosphorylase
VLDTVCESDVEPEKPTIIFIGGSHLGRLAAAAAGLEVEVVNLSMPGFRVCEETIEMACILLREAIQECSGKVVVVYQLFDNNVFFETREDGSRSLQ